MALGDHLSPEQRAEFVRTRLVPGRIVRTVLTLRSQKLIKYLLVAHVGVETLGLVINTGINDFRKSRPELLECQIPIDKLGHPSLDHDCFVDCTYAHYEDTDTLRTQLVADIGGVKDQV